MMGWEVSRSLSFKHAAELSYSDKHSMEDMLQLVNKAVKWCRNNRIMFWHSSVYILQFTNKRDLMFFMLRFE